MSVSSVTDARAVIVIEKLIRNGYAVRSKLESGSFIVTIASRACFAAVSGACEIFTGRGGTFPEALYAALRELPGVAL